MSQQKTKKLPFYTGIFYYFIRPIARIGIWVYYRKIYLSHLDKIPKNKPVIIAANHPTGFMEPCVMAVFMWRPLFFLVRGDFFRKPIFNFLLRSLNMIPIFRRGDGNFRDMKSNYASFEYYYQALRQNKTIMIFPEGSARHEKRLRPIRKGISRMAFGAFESSDDMEDLYIVPVGVSYTYSERPRSEIMVSCADPISVRQIFEETDSQFASFDKKLRQILTQRMKDNLIHIDNPDDDELLEYLYQVNRIDVLDRSILPVLSKNDVLLKADHKITAQVADWTDEYKQEIIEKARPLFSKLEQHNVPVHLLQKKGSSRWLKVMALFLTAIPAFLGYIITYPATAPAKNIADTRVKRTEFYSPVILATHLATFLIFYLVFFLVALITGLWWILLMGIGAGILAYISILWRETYRNLKWQNKYKNIKAEEKQALQKMLEEVKAFL